MFPLKRLMGVSLFVFVLAGTAMAQGIPAPVEMPREAVATGGSAPLVTVAVTAERVRFVSPGIADRRHDIAGKTTPSTASMLGPATTFGANNTFPALRPALCPGLQSPFAPSSSIII